jgi:septum formation protein
MTSFIHPWIYLASASPRRRELLEQIGIGYRLLPVEIDERLHPGEAPEVYVLRLALEKAHAGAAVLANYDLHPVLGADTAVVIDGQILGKPRDRDDALAMLERLGGQCHQVFTGVAVVCGAQAMSRLSVSHVCFRAITRQEAEVYWASGEPADKAGAYAVQGRGALFIERLEGSYSGVMGLPLFETAELLRAFAIDALKGNGYE